jgi:CitMHS family citrate-Mg2+:H+ or citrate-Ca2+:H+ symporter
MRICIGTVAMTLIVALDGDGTTTYMITVSALLPLYRHMKMDVQDHGLPDHDVESR